MGCRFNLPLLQSFWWDLKQVWFLYHLLVGVHSPTQSSLTHSHFASCRRYKKHWDLPAAAFRWSASLNISSSCFDCSGVNWPVTDVYQLGSVVCKSTNMKYRILNVTYLFCYKTVTGFPSSSPKNDPKYLILPLNGTNLPMQYQTIHLFFKIFVVILEGKPSPYPLRSSLLIFVHLFDDFFFSNHTNFNCYCSSNEMICIAYMPTQYWNNGISFSL